MRALLSSENAKVVRELSTDVCPRCCLTLRLGLLRCSFFFTARDFWTSLWRNKAVAVMLLGFDKRIDAEVEDARRERERVPPWMVPTRIGIASVVHPFVRTFVQSLPKRSVI